MLTLFRDNKLNRNRKDIPTAFDLFDEWFGSPTLFDSHYLNYLGSPITYKETSSGVNIQISVPGYSKEDLVLNLDKNILHLTNKTEGDAKPVVNYRVQLSSKVDESSIKSVCKNGLLTIDASYKQPEKGRSITIE